MPHIHPTAFVDPEAELAADVQIGAYCIVQGKVKLAAGNRLLSHVVIHGPADIGPNNKFYPFSTTGFAPQDRGYDPAVPGAGIRIGRGNVFRESVSLHRASRDTPTTLGDYNYLMANCHVGHDAHIGSHCTLANAAAIAGHVTLEDHVTFGGNAAIHQFCRVGALTMVGGCVAIANDVPPYCTSYSDRSVGSLNLVGLRRAGLREHLPKLREAFDIAFRQRHANPVAAQLILDRLGDDPCCERFARFIQQSTRGLVRFYEPEP